MRSEPVWLVYNPVSGRGRGRRVAESVTSRLEAAGRTVRCSATERPGHAVQLAREAGRQGASVVGILGGDGTVRDVVEGVGASGIPLAILPGGTGNDLARTLGIPRALPAAVDILLNGAPRSVDVWLWNGCPYVNVAGVGLDAAVAETVNRRLRGVRGTLAYLLGVATTLPGFRPLSLRLTGDSWTYEGEVMLAAAANAQYYGGGMRIAPGAVPDDGRLSVVVVGAVTKAELARQMPRVFSGTHLSHPKVRAYDTNRLAVDTEREQIATLDGELLGRTPAVVERAPYQARFLVPPAAARTR